MATCMAVSENMTVLGHRTWLVESQRESLYPSPLQIQGQEATFLSDFIAYNSRYRLPLFTDVQLINS